MSSGFTHDHLTAAAAALPTGARGAKGAEGEGNSGPENSLFGISLFPPNGKRRVQPWDSIGLLGRGSRGPGFLFLLGVVPWGTAAGGGCCGVYCLRPPLPCAKNRWGRGVAVLRRALGRGDCGDTGSPVALRVGGA